MLQSEYVYNKRKTHTSEKEKNMKRIAKFDELIKRTSEGEELKFTDFPEVVPTLYWAYRSSLRRGLEEIDFKEVIWEKDIEIIVKDLREAGYESFTISSTFSSLLETIWEFEQRGCKMVGLKQVRQGYDNYNEETRKMEPAFKPAALIRL